MTSKKLREVSSPSELQNFVTFSDIGGLHEHINTLKELIIFPLLYQNVYDKFKIRPPRGVLFHGPPGTGKTLIAGALAKECSREINGKVTFFSRKGGDILNKWVGESEEKLRALFAEASNCHPSIIFFDEIDGLAPIRSSRQDHVHANIVATLLALMDGLDKLPGVVVIGATNRIDAIDPALRRPGRFDRELYFPLPNCNAREEILNVHMKPWSVKPKATFLSYLADVTAGYSGSDLQALCSEAVMSCLRRNYPKIHTSKINIRMRTLRVSESDFITAKTSIRPSINREITPQRRLSPAVQPLLQRQLEIVINELKIMSPHFVDPDFKYDIGSKRYAGRLLLVGDSNQGHNTHMAPAILHCLEHIPSYIIDIQSLYRNASSQTAEEICVQQLTQAKSNLPAIMLAYRLDEWWDIVEESTRAVVVSLLQDLHAGLPLLIIATASNDLLPTCLINFFSTHGSVVHNMENPNEEERGKFFYKLFMENALLKCKSAITRQSKLERNKRNKLNNENDKQNKNTNDNEILQVPETSGSIKRKSSNMSQSVERPLKVQKTQLEKSSKYPWSPLFSFARKIQESLTCIGLKLDKNNIQTHYVNKNFTPDTQEYEKNLQTDRKSVKNKHFRKCFGKQTRNYKTNDIIIPGDSKISNTERLKYLYQRTVSVTSNNMAINNLELLYDMLATCINRENQNVSIMLENIGNILSDFESKNTEAVVDY